MNRIHFWLFEKQLETTREREREGRTSSLVHLTQVEESLEALRQSRSVYISACRVGVRRKARGNTVTPSGQTWQYIFSTAELRAQHQRLFYFDPVSSLGVREFSCLTGSQSRLGLFEIEFAGLICLSNKCHWTRLENKGSNRNTWSIIKTHRALCASAQSFWFRWIR
jgi:hypothetical protein